jgi:N-acetylmuramic acid 6-phosphate etherase
MNVEIKFYRKVGDIMNGEISTLTTERRHQLTGNIDQLATGDILKLINQEDQTVPQAVEKVLPQIEQATEAVYRSFVEGGSLYYVGAGTSGRLGILDAAECPPTFGTEHEMVIAIIAGGDHAIKYAVEGAEDDPQQGVEDLSKHKISSKDVVFGITASGRTPYVIGALEYAKKLGAKTIALSSNENAIVSKIADHSIEVIVGPEILAGSTRMKAGTAHKMVLNMITTTTMIKLGKVYENLMVDLNANNTKLVERARQIIMQITDVPYEKAEQVLKETNYEVKPAIVMIQAKVSYEMAQKGLLETNGFVRDAIKIFTREDHEYEQI